MTTTNRMSHFKRLAERFAQGEKLLTTQEKIMIMAHRLADNEDNLIFDRPRFPRLQLVLRAGKKHVPH